MIVDIFHWTSKLSQAVLIGGDFNMSIAGAAPLTLAHMWGLIRVGDNSPATRGKNGGIFRGKAIDHTFINAKMRDCAFRGGVNHERHLSDQFSLDHEFSIKTEPFMVTKWPRPMKIPNEKAGEPLWCCPSRTYSEWSSYATKWIADAFGISQVSKVSVHSEVYKQPPVPVEPQYQTILAAQRAIAHMKRSYRPTPQQGASLRRKLLALQITAESMEDAERELDQHWKMYMESSQKEALAEWRKKVLAWSTQQKDIFKFLRNAPPAKAAMIMLPTGPTTHPYHIQRALHSYWSSIETWPHGRTESEALDLLEDEYSMFVPNLPTTIGVTGQAVHKNIKKAKVTSPGLDGWSLAELRQLPKIAICEVVDLWWSGMFHKGSVTVNMYRRVPIQKGEATLATPDMFRPIDIFPLLSQVDFHNSSPITCPLEETSATSWPVCIKRGHDPCNHTTSHEHGTCVEKNESLFTRLHLTTASFST